jgi:hypothetical protein
MANCSTPTLEYPATHDERVRQRIGNGGESGIVFRPISEITVTMEKSFYPFVIADAFRIAAMELDEG